MRRRFLVGFSNEFEYAKEISASSFDEAAEICLKVLSPPQSLADYSPQHHRTFAAYHHKETGRILVVRG